MPSYILEFQNSAFSAKVRSRCLLKSVDQRLFLMHKNTLADVSLIEATQCGLERPRANMTFRLFYADMLYPKWRK